jgi:hypothetical protein
VGSDRDSIFVGVVILADRDGSVARENVIQGIFIVPTHLNIYHISMEGRYKNEIQPSVSIEKKEKRSAFRTNLVI